MDGDRNRPLAKVRSQPSTSPQPSHHSGVVRGILFVGRCRTSNRCILATLVVAGLESNLRRWSAGNVANKPFRWFESVKCLPLARPQRCSRSNRRAALDRIDLLVSIPLWQKAPSMEHGHEW